MKQQQLHLSHGQLKWIRSAQRATRKAEAKCIAEAIVKVKAKYANTISSSIVS